MINKESHINMDAELTNNTRDMISKLKIPWKQSKEEIWEKMSAGLDEKNKPAIKVFFPAWQMLSVAAVLLILMCSFAIMRFYTKKISSEAGQQVSISLPDGSAVRLNAQSVLKYHPFWWMFSRKVDFDGEGFFLVKKGQTFEILSANGKTQVLGTSFNIYSRNNQYKVSCKTGKVKVLSMSGKCEVTLQPNEMAVLRDDGQLDVKQNIDVAVTSSWIENKFIFTSASFRDVIDEISRQYAIPISFPANMDFVYTGSFTKDKKSVEDVLTLVCKPFNISFEKKLKGGYHLYQNR